MPSTTLVVGMMHELISVYMTVRNGMPYVEKTVRSIMGQTYMEWELIVVDDGSSDNTLEVLECMARYDSRIKVIVSGGVGRSRALNLAIEHARAQYLANIDADDLMHPQRLAIQKSIMDDNFNIQVLATDSILFFSGDPSWPPEFKCIEQVQDVTDEILYHNPISHPSVMIRRDVLNRVGGYNEKRVRQVDYDLWARLVAYGISLYKVKCSLVAKRIHDGQSFENKGRCKYLLSSFFLQRTIIKHSRKAFPYSMYPYFRLLYGFTPQYLRVKLHGVLVSFFGR
ncbi:glycosyltransferase family 2 protein [Onishia taeanensis]